MLTDLTIYTKSSNNSAFFFITFCGELTLGMLISLVYIYMVALPVIFFYAIYKFINCLRALNFVGFLLVVLIGD